MHSSLNSQKSKSIVAPLHALRAYSQCEGTSPRILNLLMEVSGKPHAPASLPSEKEPMVPINRRMDGPQKQSENSG
jgi:hypothetical protein